MIISSNVKIIMTLHRCGNHERLYSLFMWKGVHNFCSLSNREMTKTIAREKLKKTEMKKKELPGKGK